MLLKMLQKRKCFLHNRGPHIALSQIKLPLNFHAQTFDFAIALMVWIVESDCMFLPLNCLLWSRERKLVLNLSCCGSGARVVSKHISWNGQVRFYDLYNNRDPDSAYVWTWVFIMFLHACRFVLRH